MASAVPIVDGKRVFKVVANTQEEEDTYNYVEHRQNVKLVGCVGSIAHIVKGALAGGILSGHVAYMKSGWLVAIILNIIFGIYMTYCLHLLVQSAQILYKRTRIPYMTYPDVGECSMAVFPNPKIAKWSKKFRYAIDAVICMELFGACTAYQLIIAKSIKQLVENTHEIHFDGKPGYPNLRVYLVAMILPIIIICWIRHLKWLAPFSILANFVIVLCIIMTVHYAFSFNPKFENITTYKSIYNSFIFIGMNVFSMSCAGIAVSIENNMKEPHKFPFVIAIGMGLVIICTFALSFFGYVAFLEQCEAPITVNFPMVLLPKIIKALIALMIYVSHALNFWVPFNLCYYYIQKRHSDKKFWEYFYRTIFVLLISIVAIVFPNINAIMGFLGSFCLTNMAFIFPNIIHLLVVWKRPGLGKYKWRLWRSLFFIIIGVFVFCCGTVVNGMEMVNVLTALLTK